MQNKTRIARVMGAFLLSVVACNVSAEDRPGAWTTIPGGEGTGCSALKTPYEFYVRAADKRRVAVYFQGGGGCWNERNCGLAGQQTFDAVIDATDRPWDAKAAGIFDFASSRNPLRDYTVVFAPYCTADVHLGVRTGRFETGDGKSRLDINYRGLANAQRVMDWVMSQHSDVEVMFVGGGSAGAIPSPVFASQLARRYPDARVVQLGDGAGAYRTARVSGLLKEWGATTALKNDPLYRELNPATANFEDLYFHASKTPNLRLAQINSVDDQIQVFFLGQLGHPGAVLPPLLSGNLSQLRAANPNLRTYSMPGVMHTILQRPDFYTAKVGDIALAQWVDDLLNDRDVKNVGDELLPAAADRLQ